MKLNFLFGLLVLPGLLFADVHFFANPPEEDPVWAAARSGYATTGAVAAVRAEAEAAAANALAVAQSALQPGALTGYATTGAVAAVRAEAEAAAANALAVAQSALQPGALTGYATTGAVAAVRAEVEAAASPKLTMVPAGTTVISTDTTVQVVPTRGIYNLQVQGDSDISFDLSSIDITNNVARWETWINVYSPSVTVSLPSSSIVQYLETPDLTTTTLNELLQISWQAWMDGTNLMMQGHLYNRRTDMPIPMLAKLRTYHYGDPNIVESPASWFVFDAETKTITGFNYVDGRENVVIPWEIDGVAVEVLGDAAFSPDPMFGYPITNVVAGRSVLGIGNHAFNRCDSLTSVTLPAATYIGGNAFYYCGSLTSVTLPVATSIGNNAFDFCTKLTSVTLPAATSIGDHAFIGTKLTSIDLPVATSIGNNAFAGTPLTSIDLPAATSIGERAFSGCGSLTSVTLPAATSIGNEALTGTLLTSVTLPAATSIGGYAFAGSASLSSVYFGNATPAEGQDMFIGVPGPVTIYYPAGAPAWSSVTTWGGMPTAPYTP